MTDREKVRAMIIGLDPDAQAGDTIELDEDRIDTLTDKVMALVSALRQRERDCAICEGGALQKLCRDCVRARRILKGVGL